MQLTDIVSLAGLIFAGIGLGLTGIGLISTSRQLELSRRVTLGEFLLHLDEIFQQHKEAHSALRPGGKWSNGEGPMSTEEWVIVETYMGIFERINVLIEKNIIEADTVKRFYEYRVQNIVANPVIRKAKLNNEARSWTDFIKLCERLGITIE